MTCPLPEVCLAPLTMRQDLEPFPDVKSQLNLQAWSEGLRNHQDSDFTKQLLHGIEFGIDIGYTGPRKLQIHDIWPSISKYQEAVEENINSDLIKQRSLVPYTAPPSSSFVRNPIRAFPKKRSQKVSVITDLSWTPGGSVSQHIPREQYIKFNEIVSAVKSCGYGAVMAKLDLESAFKQILVKKGQWDLL